MEFLLDSSIYDQEMDGNPANSDDDGDTDESVEMIGALIRPPPTAQIAPVTAALGVVPQSPISSPSLKRRRSDQENKPSCSDLNETTREEGEVCSICFEPYESMGKHRLSCLKCGHLFGANCIERWLPVGSKGGVCPQCKMKATRKDIRIIYSKGIKVVDNTEVEWTKKEIEVVRVEKRQMEMELAEVKLKLQTQIELSNSLQLRLQSLSSVPLSDPTNMPGTSASRHHPTTTFTSSPVAYRFLKTVEFSKDAECRIMDFCAEISTMVCSQVAVNSLFPGHGIKKVNLAVMKPTDYLPLHSKQIRTLKFSPDDPGVLLSAADDKFMKLTNMYTNSNMHSFDVKSPAWSCAWKTGEPNYVFAGLVNGSVQMFDTRMLFNNSQDNAGSVVTISNPNISRTPVVSLQWISYASELSARSSGLLVGHSGRCVFYECLSPTEFKPHLLPITGSLFSLCYDASSNSFLASYRPSESFQDLHDRHLLCEMSSQNVSTDPTRMDPMYSCNVVNTYRGSTESPAGRLYRPFLWRNPFSEGASLAATWVEESNAVKVWDAATGVEKLTINNLPKVRDISAHRLNDTSLLNVLTETSLRIYQMQPS